MIYSDIKIGLAQLCHDKIKKKLNHLSYQPVAAPSNIEMKLFKKVAINNQASDLAKNKERNDRSCIVRQPGSKELNNSKII